jgi:hypothetical protein
MTPVCLLVAPHVGAHNLRGGPSPCWDSRAGPGGLATLPRWAVVPRKRCSLLLARRGAERASGASAEARRKMAGARVTQKRCQVATDQPRDAKVPRYLEMPSGDPLAKWRPTALRAARRGSCLAHGRWAVRRARHRGLGSRPAHEPRSRTAASMRHAVWPQVLAGLADSMRHGHNAAADARGRAACREGGRRVGS